MSSAPSRQDREAAERAHEVAQRAIRRLDLLEAVMIGGGAILALLGGALIAVVLNGLGGLTFRRTWMVASLVLFVVPGGIAIIKIRSDARAHARRRAGTTAPNPTDAPSSETREATDG